MGVRGLRFKLGMELTPDKPGMIFEFDDLHQSLIGGESGEDESRFSQRIQIGIVKPVTVAVTLNNQLLL
jgi:hypothetical protein